MILFTQNSALQFRKPGTEYIGLLYSNEPIQDVWKKLNQVKKEDLNFINALYNSFGKEMIPINQIIYKQNQMEFQNQIKNGSIIPLILELKIH